MGGLPGIALAVLPGILDKVLSHFYVGMDKMVSLFPLPLLLG
jgi:hypothetical protein